MSDQEHRPRKGRTGKVEPLLASERERTVDPHPNKAADKQVRPSGRPILKKILESAADSFARNGYEGARMEEIASKARVNKAMLYYHIGNKEALYAAVMGEYERQVLQHITRSTGPNETAEENLRTAIEALFEAMVANPIIARLLLRQMVSRQGLGNGLGRVPHFSDGLREAFRRGAAEGIWPTADITLLNHLALDAVLMIALDEVNRASTEKRNETACIYPSRGHLIAKALSRLILKAAVDGPSEASRHTPRKRQGKSSDRFGSATALSKPTKEHAR